MELNKRLSKLEETIKPAEPAIIEKIIVVRGVQEDTLTINGNPITQKEYSALLADPTKEVTLIIVEYDKGVIPDTRGARWLNLTLERGE